MTNCIFIIRANNTSVASPSVTQFSTHITKIWNNRIILNLTNERKKSMGISASFIVSNLKLIFLIFFEFLLGMLHSLSLTNPNYFWTQISYGLFHSFASNASIVGMTLVFSVHYKNNNFYLIFNFVSIQSLSLL
jgi:hypothetical protein